MFFFFFLNILIPNVAEKNIQILKEEKKNNLIESFCHKLMLNSGKKIRAQHDKKKYSNFCDVRKKYFERTKKT